MEEAGVSYPYAKGAPRDVRLRAAGSVAKLERTLHGLDDYLRQIERVGRYFRMKYHRQHEAFAWWFKRGVRDWIYVGVRIPMPLKGRVFIRTRRHIDDIERCLDARQGGRAVLRLVRMWLTEESWWEADCVRLRWRGEPGGQVGVCSEMTWAFRGQGHCTRGGTYRSVREVPATYRDVVASFGRDGSGVKTVGPLAAKVAEVVTRLETCDEQLGKCAAALRNGCRLYYKPLYDTWECMCVIIGEVPKHLSWEEVLAAVRVCGRSCGPCGPRSDSDVFERAVELLVQRQRLKRVLQLVAVLAEAGGNWPGGTWHLSGYDRASSSAKWASTIDDQRALVRRYGELGGSDTLRVTLGGDGDGNGRDEHKGLGGLHEAGMVANS